MTRTQEYAVRYLKQTMNMDPVDIAKELKISQSEIDKLLKDIPLENNKKTGVNNMMINETSGKKSKNVSIMTQQASQYNDEAAKKINDSVNKSHPGIYRPRG